MTWGWVNYQQKCFKKWTTPLKGTFTQKFKFCHHLLTQLFQTCMNNNKKIFWRMLVSKLLTGPIDFQMAEKKNTMEVNRDHQLFGYQHSSKYLLLCSAEERNSYKFGTWGWVNDDRFPSWDHFMDLVLIHSFCFNIIFLILITFLHQINIRML